MNGEIAHISMETARAIGARVRLTVAPSAARVMPGDRVEFALTVRNSGDVPDRYRIDVVGLQRLWYDLAETRVALAPDESTTVALMAHPVDTASFAAGRYPFRVRVTSEDEPAVQASVTVNFAAGTDAPSATPPGSAATSESPRRAPARGVAASASARDTDSALAARPRPAPGAPPDRPQRAALRGAAPPAAAHPAAPPAAAHPAATPESPRRVPSRGAVAPAAAHPAAVTPDAGPVPGATSRRPQRAPLRRAATPVAAAHPAPARHDAAATPAIAPEATVASDAGVAPAAVLLPVAPAPIAVPDASPVPPTTSTLTATSTPAAVPATAPPGALPATAPPPRRIPTWAALPVLVVLLGAAAVLTLHAAGAGPFAARPRPVVAPAATPVAPTTRRAGGSPARPVSPISTATLGVAGPTATARAPRGVVKGIVAHAPAIGRFVLVRGRGRQPDRLLWDTRHAGRVTLNGVAVPARGTRLLRGAVEGATYRLDARDGGRLVTARVRIPPGGVAQPASAAPVALFNMAAVTFGARGERSVREARTIHLVNLGPGLLTVASVALSGQDPEDFSVRTTCTNRPIPVDAGCAIYVAFVPTNRGARAADLIVADNTAASPHAIATTGRGG